MEITPGPKSLLDCPVEILRVIFSHDTSLAGLDSLSRTSRDIRVLTEPLLYSRIEWEWVRRERPPRVALLLRTLLHRPDLAAHVRVFAIRAKGWVIRYFHWEEAATLSGHPGLSDQEVEDAVRKASPDPSLAARWISEARALVMDAFVALLLAQLPGLTELILTCPLSRNMGMVGRLMLSGASHDHGRFRRLRSVQVDLDPDWNNRLENDDGMEDALAMFYLPSVRHIEAVIGNPRSTFAWPASTPEPSALTSLNLRGIREPHLADILKSTRSLTRLSWEWFKTPEMRRTSYVLDLDAVSAALGHVEATLAELIITADLSPGQAPELPRIEIRGAVESLRAMQRLESLQVPYIFLLGSAAVPHNHTRRLQDALPQTLRRLSLTNEMDCYQWHVNDEHGWSLEHQFDTISAWLQASRTATPLVHTLVLAEWKWDQWDSDMFIDLRDVGTACDVLVEYRWSRGWLHSAYQERFDASVAAKPACRQSHLG